jgi:hypothetical protein
VAGCASSPKTPACGGARTRENDQFAIVNGKANWQARDYLDCDFWMLARDASGKFKGSVPPQLSKVGPADKWGYNHADGNYRGDLDLAPGFAFQHLGSDAGCLVLERLEESAVAYL